MLTNLASSRSTRSSTMAHNSTAFRLVARASSVDALRGSGPASLNWLYLVRPSPPRRRTLAPLADPLSPQVECCVVFILVLFVRPSHFLDGPSTRAEARPARSTSFASSGSSASSRRGSCGSTSGARATPTSRSARSRSASSAGASSSTTCATSAGTSLCEWSEVRSRSRSLQPHEPPQQPPDASLAV